MKRASLVVIVAAAALFVSAGTARAFIGGSLVYGHCSLTATPCSFDFMCPCWPAGTCAPGTFETCVANSLSGTDGESSAVQSGPFECKVKTPKGTPLNQTVKVNEDSLLVLVNEHAATTLCACITLFDGHQNPLAAFTTQLLGVDVDEINLCNLAGPIPLGGMTGHVVVVTSTGACPYSGTFQGGDYAWVKSVVYSGTKKNPADPFSVTNVRASHEIQLRVTPGGVETGSNYGGVCNAGTLPAPAAAYLENTFE